MVRDSVAESSMRTSTLTVALVSALLIGSAGTVGALTAIGPLQPQQSPTGTTTPGTNVGTTTPSSGPGITFNNQQSTGETVFIKSATLSQKGFVVIYDPTRPGNTSNKIIGVSYLLGAGTTNNIRIQLDQPINQTTSLTAVIHIDSNNNGQFDYVSSNGQQDPAPPKGNGRTVDIAQITVQSTDSQTQTDTGGTTTASDGSTGADPGTQTQSSGAGNGGTTADSGANGGSGNDNGSANGGDGSSGMFGPGFGFVVAVVALLGIALLAVRRN